MFKRILISLALLASPALRAADVAATLLKASGEGQLILPSGATAAFKAGALLQPGTRLVTREGALAVLMMDDGSRVSVGPNTELTLTESRKEGEQRSTVFDLVRGLFHATVQKLTLGSRFEVKTQDAVAAVKGTDFEVASDDKGTEARVSEGTVWMENERGERSVVGARMAARAERHGALSQPRPLSEQELRNIGGWAREALAPHSGALLPVDQARRAAWEALRPEQRAQVWKDLKESLGDTWSDIAGLRTEERQERWRDRLRANDERRLAAEGAHVDFALGKCALDRQGRRVRFDEFLLRPQADQIQFVNYTRRDDRTDVISSLNTYNQALPRDLREAPGLNQRVWLQGFATPPRYWVVQSALVGGNNSGDSFSALDQFYAPFYRALAGYWELPVKQVELRLNIPDLHSPSVGGELVERWVRTYDNSSDPNTIVPSATLTALAGVAANANLTVALRSVPGSVNNLPDSGTDVLGGTVTGLNLANTNLNWALGDSTTLPTTTLLDRAGLEAKPGDLAFGFRRTYNSPGEVGRTLEFRNYVINENGEIVNLSDVDPNQLMQEFVSRHLITSLKQLELRSNAFQESDGIDVVSKLLFLHDLSKTRDQL